MSKKDRPDAEADAEAQRGSVPNRKQSKLEWLAKAMLLVKEHPEWPDSDIALEVGVHKGTLSKSQEYQAAADLARHPRKAHGKGTLASTRKRENGVASKRMTMTTRPRRMTESRSGATNRATFLSINHGK